MAKSIEEALVIMYGEEPIQDALKDTYNSAIDDIMVALDIFIDKNKQHKLVLMALKDHFSQYVLK